MQINTVQTITHTEQNTNIFTPEKNQIAFPGILPSIKFRQWHLTDKVLQLTKNSNVARYASIVGAFAVMGKYGFQIPHKTMAELYARLYECKAPAPQTIHKWESICVKIGIFEKPRHMLFGGLNKSKLRVFTDFFWNMARKYCEKKLSYICPPSTLWRSPSSIVRKENLQPKDPTNLYKYETPERVRDDIESEPETTPPAHAERFENQKRDTGKEQTFLNGNHRKALKQRGCKKPPLPKILNQVFFHIMTKSAVKDTQAAILFFSDIIRANNRGDEVTRQFFSNWPQLSEGAKQAYINNLLAHMRKNGGEGPGVAQPVHPLQLIQGEGQGTAKPVRHLNSVDTLETLFGGAFELPGDERDGDRNDPEVKALLAACLHKKPYRGRRPDLLAKISRLAKSEFDNALLQLMDGRLP